MDVIEALEHTACDTQTPRATAYAAAIFRWQLGCSGRFDDIQHIAPQHFHVHKQTIEGLPWQTKTLDITSVKPKRPLIAIKHSFTGHPWWNILEQVTPNLNDLHAKVNMQCDYMLPTPSSDFTQLIPRPCTYSKALVWLRHILTLGKAPPNDIASTTLHSLRVWAAEYAYQAGITREKRKHIA